jgi:hypothetical protein
VADAVRLVDGEGAHARALDPLQEARGEQSLGRDEDETELAAGEAVLDRAKLFQIEAAVERGGRVSAFREPVDLVLHQRDQRRDHEVRLAGDRGRHLVAERLAAAGRQHDQRIAALEPGPDRRLLQVAERVEPPVAVNRLEDGGGAHGAALLRHGASQAHSTGDASVVKCYR